MPYKDPQKAKECMRKSYLKNREKQIQREKDKRKENPFLYDAKNTICQLKRRQLFIISLEDYLNLYNKSKGICKICKNKNKIDNRKLALDHCHKSGKFRGFLCDKCNRGLGFFNDNTEILKSAISYLGNEKNKIKT